MCFVLLHNDANWMRRIQTGLHFLLFSDCANEISVLAIGNVGAEHKDEDLNPRANKSSRQIDAPTENILAMFQSMRWHIHEHNAPEAE